MIFYIVQMNTLPVSLPQSSTAKQETRPNVVLITVMKSGDKSARYESVVAVFNLLKKSGAYRMSIATEMKKGN